MLNWLYATAYDSFFFLDTLGGVQDKTQVLTTRPPGKSLYTLLMYYADQKWET